MPTDQSFPADTTPLSNDNVGKPNTDSQPVRAWSFGEVAARSALTILALSPAAYGIGRGISNERKADAQLATRRESLSAVPTREIVCELKENKPFRLSASVRANHPDLQATAQKASCIAPDANLIRQPQTAVLVTFRGNNERLGPILFTHDTQKAMPFKLPRVVTEQLPLAFNASRNTKPKFAVLGDASVVTRNDDGTTTATIGSGSSFYGKAIDGDKLVVQMTEIDTTRSDTTRRSLRFALGSFAISGVAMVGIGQRRNKTRVT